jgi:hypothetical protein
LPGLQNGLSAFVLNVSFFGQAGGQPRLGPDGTPRLKTLSPNLLSRRELFTGRFNRELAGGIVSGYF